MWEKIPQLPLFKVRSGQVPDSFPKGSKILTGIVMGTQRTGTSMAFQDPQNPGPAAGDAVSLKMKSSQISEASFLCYFTVLLFLYVISCNLAELTC